jgi:SAM-dependent methyltransferase
MYLLKGQKPHSQGYNEYKSECLRRYLASECLALFRENDLPSGFGYRLDERAVEYPWLFSRIKSSEKVVLDAGSALNFSDLLVLLQKEKRKVYIDTLYYEGHVAVKPSPSYVYDDLRTTCFKDAFFDAIYSLSTVEHIGLDNTANYIPDESYREEDGGSYLEAISELRRVLKPEGTLYVTIPYGTYRNYGWFQIFDKGMVDALIKSFNPVFVDTTYYIYENDQWNVSTETACAGCDYFDPHSGDNFTHDFLAGARSVVCIELKKPACPEKPEIP